MLFADAVLLLEDHENFSEPNGSYLAHGFMSFSRGETGQWQIGYYDPDSDRITSYHIQGGHVLRSEPADVFKDDDSVPRLDLESVRVSHADATRIAHDRLSQAYTQHPLMKTIMLLQVVDDEPVYNFTIVTQSLHMLNVRVHAKTGRIVHEQLESLMELRADG